MKAVSVRSARARLRTGTPLCRKSTAGVSPLVGTLLLVAVAIVVAGIAFIWGQSYSQQTTQNLSEDVASYAQTTLESFGIRIDEINSDGKVVIENIGTGDVTVTGFYIDGIFFDVNDFTLYPGTKYRFSTNASPFDTADVKVVTSSGATKQELIDVTLSGVLLTITFSDNLDDNSNISDSNSVRFSGGGSRLSVASSNWTTVSGSTGNTNLIASAGTTYSAWTYRQALALDVNDVPYIAWESYDEVNEFLDEAYMRKWNGIFWSDMGGAPVELDDINVSKTGGFPNYSYRVAIAVDSNKIPHVVWNEESPDQIFYKKWSAAADNWVDPRGNPGLTEDANVSKTPPGVKNFNPKVAVDSNGTPHVVWQTGMPVGNAEIYYREWSPTQNSWVDARGNTGLTVDLNVDKNASSSSYYPSLALDSLGRPHIAWSEQNPGNTYEIYYRYWNGNNWVTVSGDATPGDNGANVKVSNMGKQSRYPSLVLDSNNIPHIAFDYLVGGADWEIAYREWSPSKSAWVTVSGSSDPTVNAVDLKVSNNVSTSSLPALALDAQGLPHISWNDNAPGNFDVYHREWGPSQNAWVDVNGGADDALNVSRDAGTSDWATIALNSHGNPCIVWEDDTDGRFDAYYRYWRENYYLSGSITSGEIDGTIRNILAATLIATANIPQGTDINFYLSNDNGATWTQVNSGVLHEFSSTGAQLRWRAVFTTTNQEFTPELLKVDVEYSYNAQLQTASFLDDLSSTANIDGSSLSDFSSGGFRLLSQYWATAGGNTGLAADLNVSNLSNASEEQSMVLDSNGVPHIAWSDNKFGGKKILYREWSPSQNAWVDVRGNTGITEDLNVNKATWGFYPSLRLDSNGNPHIAWYETPNGEILYRKWNGSNWVDVKGNTGVTADLNVSKTSGGSSYPSLFLDSNNIPHIAWTEVISGNTEIFYREWSSTANAWVDIKGNQGLTADLNASKTSASSDKASLFLDSNGVPYIAWHDEAASSVYYRDWNGTNWVDAKGNVGITNDLNVSKNIIYSMNPSLFLDSNGIPHIAWESTAFDLGEIFYRDWNGTNWVDAAGNLGLTADLNVSKLSAVRQARFPSLALNGSGAPHIAWTSISADSWYAEIFYRDWNGSNWVDIKGNLGVTDDLNVSRTVLPDINGYPSNPSLVLDSNNVPHVAWRDNLLVGSVYREIFYREWHGNYASSGNASSTVVDAVAQNIIRATLTAAVNQPAGTSITFYLSNNNGYTWEQVDSGVLHSFSSVGSQLRWKAILSTTDVTRAPEVLDVRIVYYYTA